MATAAAQAAPYVSLVYLCQILLQFLVLVFMVDVIGLSYLDAICSSTLLICMLTLPAISLVMIYQLLI
jgi:hypothetical protein